MAKLKTRKSIIKRFKFTRSGKVLRRAIGQDHARMKKTGKQKRQKRKWVVLSVPETKKIKKALLG
ncbi:50S ribosomal protein L35 [Patescibacteria group bacterium]|nr:50S ribosomal protein L35 [Patescibacteria group bacterium]